MAHALHSRTFPVSRYDLATTLNCGQAFRWQLHSTGWQGVIEDHWLQVNQDSEGLRVETTHRAPDWPMLANYFQVEIDIATVTKNFPSDPHIARAIELNPGLRLLKQSPWECLASFILSSTKQIPHIQKIIQGLACQFGEKLKTPASLPAAYTFPTAKCLSRLNEQVLRRLGMGYRARYLSQSAKQIDSGKIDLHSLENMPYCEAKETLQQLPGVGPKIADCVLLFAYGKQEAFPVDVWVRRALMVLYFPTSNPSPKQLAEFIASYFGNYAGYAQQYLFHYMRTQSHRDPNLQSKTST